jgi:hypothetical protein
MKRSWGFLIPKYYNYGFENLYATVIQRAYRNYNTMSFWGFWAKGPKSPKWHCVWVPLRFTASSLAILL